MVSGSPRLSTTAPWVFEEFEKLIDKVLYVSATPGRHEEGCFRSVYRTDNPCPPGLSDPEVEVKTCRRTDRGSLRRDNGGGSIAGRGFW